MMPVILRFVVGLLAYMFPYEVLAKIIVLLLERLAKATTFTKVDDKVVNIMKAHLGLTDEVAEDDSDGNK